MNALNAFLPAHDLYVRIGGRPSVFRVTFTSTTGLGIHEEHSLPASAPTYDISDDPDTMNGPGMQAVMTWFEHTLRGCISVFNAAYVWGYIMVVLQIVVLLLLTFEAPGPREVLELGANQTAIGLVNYRDRSMPAYADWNNTVRFISDNIAMHRGFGSVMLLSFSGSYLLLICVFSNAYVKALLVICIVASSVGGLGVVLFHDAKYHTHHIACAALFIAGGILAHVVVSVSSAKRHFVRDAVFIGMPIAMACAFLGTYWYAYKKSNDNRNHPKYITTWWISGICEYLLYISISILNLLIPGRVLQHAASTFAKMLPYVIEAYLVKHR